MTQPRSDALVLFGASGDLAYKQIFPALQAMIKRGTLNVPVIAVTGGSRDTHWWRERVHARLQRHGEVDRAAFDKLMSLMRSVLLDFTDPQSICFTSDSQTRCSSRSGTATT